MQDQQQNTLIGRIVWRADIGNALVHSAIWSPSMGWCLLVEVQNDHRLQHIAVDGNIRVCPEKGR